MIHFNDWLISKGISYNTVTVRDKREFICNRTRDPNSDRLFRHNKSTYAAAISHWIKLLASDVEILSTNNILVEEFDRYLGEVVGLASSTRLYRCRNVREFLNWFA